MLDYILCILYTYITIYQHNRDVSPKKKILGCPAHNLATVLSELYILSQQVFSCCFRITVFWIVILCSLVVVCQPLRGLCKEKPT
jgi:hypothetical protein